MKDENTQEFQHEVLQINQEEILHTTAITGRLQELQELQKEEDTIDRSVVKPEQDLKDENTQEFQHEIYNHKPNANLQIIKSKIFEEKGILYTLYYLISVLMLFFCIFRD